MRRVPYAVKQRWKKAAEMRRAMRLIERAFWDDRRYTDGPYRRFPDNEDLTGMASTLLNLLSKEANRLEDVCE